MRFHGLIILLLSSLSPVLGVNETEAPVMAPVDPPVAVPTEDTPWTGCHPRGDPNHRIEIGKKTVLCLHIGNEVNFAGGVNYIRVAFQPEADQYSRMHIPNCK